jgi:predicted O-methyltransferase YrrM
MHFPALRPEHLAGATLHVDRNHLIRALNLPPGGQVAEVGVATGDFSAFLLDALAPSLFVGIDSFTMHTVPEHWGIASAVLFRGMTHAAFYRHRFADRGAQVRVIEGWSHDGLATLADGAFSLVYIDAGHDYDSVRRDAQVAAAKLRPDGILVFNDYIMMDHLSETPYGVVPAVNELLAGGGWTVAGFALQQHMFCDIALRRAG